MSILVTGGLGTIGSGLVKILRDRGHGVVSCDLLHQPDEVGFSVRQDVSAPRYVRCDVGSYRQLQRVFSERGPFEYVYHCAAEFGRWNGEDFYESLWQTNVVGTKHLLRLQEDRGFKLVHFSSSEVYGDWTSLMMEEVMDQYEVKQLNDYAMTKWVNEMQIRNAFRRFGTESVIVRLFNTYGPGERYSPYRSVNCRFLYCALKGIPWTVYRGHRRTSTYLGDALNALANIVGNFHPGETYNIGGGTSHSIEELSDAVVSVTGADPVLALHLSSEPMTTMVKEVDISKSIRDLHFVAFHGLHEGLRLTAEWMRKEYGFA